MSDGCFFDMVGLVSWCRRHKRLELECQNAALRSELSQAKADLAKFQSDLEAAYGDSWKQMRRAERAETLVGSINQERDALEEQKFAAMKDQITKMLDLNKKSEALAKKQERVIGRLEDIVRNLTSAHEFKAPPMGSGLKFLTECICPGCLYLYGERPAPKALTPEPAKEDGNNG